MLVILKIIIVISWSSDSSLLMINHVLQGLVNIPCFTCSTNLMIDFLMDISKNGNKKIATLSL
ncbi:hypothetical protein CKY20_10290 [Capnocytophaga canis]|uniref:Uncharacterized protein n=1 Tax=Capnocytophaga canis TaxID=1848903 RepID=A0A3A1YEH6_9FLAO|nr:hypothetical protein CKY20_10290 [Capnocytophaga canis]